MAKKLVFTTNTPGATTDYAAADGTWKTIPGGGGGSGTVTSVALTAPAAFNVSGSPITTSGTLALTGAGTASQYVKGDGTLGTTPTSLPPSGSAGGDLSGTYPNPTVHRIHGIDMQSGTPSTDEVWVYGGSPAKWQHQKLQASQVSNDSTVGGTNVDNALDNLKSSIALKQDTITGAATTIALTNLTANRAVISNGSGKIAVSTVTDTELGYVSGVTSAIQTQINSKQNTITLTTTGTSGSATLVGSTLNIPQYAGSGSGTSFLSGLLSGTINAATTLVGSLVGGAVVSTGNENIRVIPMSQACALSRLYIRTNNTQPATGSLVITLRKNQVDTALVITIAASSVAGTYTNTATSISFADGDLASLKFTNNASTASNILTSSTIMVTI